MMKSDSILAYGGSSVSVDSTLKAGSPSLHGLASSVCLVDAWGVRVWVDASDGVRNMDFGTHVRRIQMVQGRATLSVGASRDEKILLLLGMDRLRDLDSVALASFGYVDMGGVAVSNHQECTEKTPNPSGAPGEI